MRDTDLDNLSNFTDQSTAKDILSNLKGSRFLDISMLLSERKSADILQTKYLAAIVEQNWIMIRQLDRIEKALTKGEAKSSTPEKVPESPKMPQKNSDLEGKPIDIGNDLWKCPNCGYDQRTDRKACFHCGLKFIRE